MSTKDEAYSLLNLLHHDRRSDENPQIVEAFLKTRDAKMFAKVDALFGIPARQFHRFLALIEEESAKSGKDVLGYIEHLEKQLRARQEHVLGAGTCWCLPRVEGGVVMHNTVAAE